MAPEETGTQLGKTAVGQMGKTIREVARRVVNETPHRARWQYQGGNLSVKHGIISAQLGCGYYTVEKARWTGNRETAGVGLGSGSGITDCDPCYDVTGEGTSGCAITLTYPPLQVTGLGTYVTAYDEASQLIPLVIGTSCKMINMGDTNDDDGSGGAAPVVIWQILRGVMNHVVEYKEEWDCCNGTGETGIETLISRTPVILIGKECASITCGTCTPGSASASV